MKRVFFWFALPLLSLVLWAGCASPEKTKVPYSLSVQAASVFHHDNARLFWFPKSGTFAKLDAGTHVRELARVMENATTRQVDVACSGPDSPSVRRAVVQALELQTSHLPGLRLLYVGDASEKDAIQKALAQLGAIFLYAPGEPK